MVCNKQAIQGHLFEKTGRFLNEEQVLMLLLEIVVREKIRRELTEEEGDGLVL